MSQPLGDLGELGPQVMPLGCMVSRQDPLGTGKSFICCSIVPLVAEPARGRAPLRELIQV